MKLLVLGGTIFLGRYFVEEVLRRGHEITGETYGALKALCEGEVEKAMRGRALLVRSGLIVGPGDPSDRFTYWPWRLAQGGEILAPGNGSSFVQLVDVRDQAKWLVSAIEARLTGVFNVTGPSKPLTLRSVLESCQKALGNQGQMTWVDEGFLLMEGVGEWVELPLWLAGEESSRMMQVNVSKALETGLIFRPIEQSAYDALSWAKSRPENHQWQAGLTLERESQLLKKWHSRA